MIHPVILYQSAVALAAHTGTVALINAGPLLLNHQDICAAEQVILETEKLNNINDK